MLYPYIHQGVSIWPAFRRLAYFALPCLNFFRVVFSENKRKMKFQMQLFINAVRYFVLGLKENRVILLDSEDGWLAFNWTILENIC